MRVKNTTEHSQGPDFELCGACGAVLEKDAKFCNRCGVKLEAPIEETSNASSVENVAAPVEDSPAEETSGECQTPADEAPTSDETVVETETANETPTADVNRFCTVCGAILEENAKFCNRCGARVQTPAGGEIAAAKKFCMNCGADVSDVKFCTNCGVAVGEVSKAGGWIGGASTAAPTADESVEAAVKKKRMVGAILYLSGAFFSIVLGFIFLCCPFISVYERTLVIFVTDGYSQSGLTLIGAMFGAHSDLVEVGVNSTLLGWAGWLYFALLITIVNHCVCVALNVSRYRRGERPYNVLSSNLSIFLISICIMVVGYIAKWQIDVTLRSGNNSSYISHSCYTGFLLVFIMALIGFGGVLAGYLFSNKAFPPRDRRAKKTGNVLTIFIVDLVCAVLIAASVAAPVCTMLDYNHDKEIEVNVGESGKAATDCDERYDGMSVGATVFKLEDMKYGEDYIFRIETDDVGQYALVGSVLLVEYDYVEDLSAAEIIGVIYDIRIDSNTEDETGDDYAYLVFNNSGQDDLAIVVGFTATSGMTVKYEYSFYMA